MRARLERSREQAASVEEFREAIDQGLAWIDQTLAMVTAVLRIGEIEHGRRRAGFAPVDLAPIVREAAEFFEPVAEDAGVALTVAVAAGAFAVEGDRDLLFEAVSNLIDNAVKFTPPGGTVRVGLEDGPAGRVIVVEDSGPGIPRGEWTQVFRRFYRAERARRTPATAWDSGSWRRSPGCTASRWRSRTRRRRCARHDPRAPRRVRSGGSPRPIGARRDPRSRIATGSATPDAAAPLQPDHPAAGGVERQAHHQREEPDLPRRSQLDRAGGARHPAAAARPWSPRSSQRWRR